MHLLAGDVVSWWRHWLGQHVTMAPGATVKGFVSEGSLYFMNGIAAMFLGISLMFTLLLARKWQAFLQHSKGFRAEFHALALPRALALPVVGLAIIVAMGIIPGEGSLWSDLLMVAVAIMYLFQGVAFCMPWWQREGPPHGGWRPLYIGLLVLPSLLVQGLALVGVASSLADFRTPRPPPA